MATALRPLRSATRPAPGAWGALAMLALILLFLAPVAMGLAGTVLPAFGILPELGGTSLTLDPWRRLLHIPGLAQAAALSLGTGLATAALSFSIVIGLAAYWHGTASFDAVRRVLSPLLSVPHVALAIGFAFLAAPSGWVFRVLSMLGLAGPLPPDIATVQDSYGLALILGLTLKEAPFLLLMTLVALGQIRLAETLTTARALGHSRSAAWLAAVLPQIYPQLRLPIYAVLAYSASVVDVALILGPTAPPTLAVMVWRGLRDPDLQQIFWASAGACLQLSIAGLAIALWRCGEIGIARIGQARIRAGWPGRASAAAALFWKLMGWGVAATALLGLAATLLWSLTARWTIASAFPQSLSLAVWHEQLGGAGRAIGATAALGLASAGAALILAIALLERESRLGESARHWHEWLIYAPLLLPQIGFLFGIEAMLIGTGLDGSWAGVAWTHFIFVLPYAYLSLSEPWRALDPRYERTALCLGHSRMGVVLTVKAPLLARPILVALALGFSVSVGQYLPTLFAGGGRVQTVTTEAVALAAGGDRRVVGVYAGLQMVLPALAFGLALMLGGGRQRRHG
jgi:putative thiamine transport system permease protein